MTDFAKTKAMFHLPKGMIYLDGNSLGPLPLAASSRVQGMMTDEWGEMLITGWNRAGWMDAPRRVGDRIARLIGADAGTVVLGDTLSIKVYQALASALEMRPGRKVVLSDAGNFPSDLYMAQGLIKSLNAGHQLKVVKPHEVADHIGPEVAALMLTEVDYRTGRLHDAKALTEAAHQNGAIAIWDLAHSAGAIPVDVKATGADFAVGCTYKYLNGGPGAPAFIYVAPKHAGSAAPALSGWLGHDAPFAFEQDYRAGAGIDRMRVGTPPILQLAALEAALDVWDVVDMQALRARSVELSEHFIKEVEARCPDLTLASPRDPSMRGSQVSFKFEHGYAAIQALIGLGVVGDFRAPNIMRFGLTPLYLDQSDIVAAAGLIGKVMDGRLWDRAEYQQRAAVT